MENVNMFNIFVNKIVSHFSKYRDALKIKTKYRPILRGFSEKGYIADQNYVSIKKCCKFPN